MALFRALTMRSLIGDILGDRAAYFDIIGDRPVSNAVENTQSQSRLL